MAKPAAIKPIEASEHINILLYGDPGSRKTTIAGSGGPGTLIIHPHVEHMDAIVNSGADHWLVKDWDEMNNVLDWARHEGDAYKWIWLDSISCWQDIGMDDIFAVAKARNPRRKEFWWDKGDYGVNMGRIAEWVRFMMGCDLFHLGITAHQFWMEVSEGEPDDGVPNMVEKMMPWVQGKGMPMRIAGYMQMVGYNTVHNSKKKEGEQYVVTRFNGNAGFYAKDQFHAFPGGKVTNLTVPKLEAAVNAAKETSATRAPTTTRRRRRVASN
jgi:hypothetical protein